MVAPELCLHSVAVAQPSIKYWNFFFSASTSVATGLWSPFDLMRSIALITRFQATIRPVLSDRLDVTLATFT
jgi:hypothetical protein